MSATDAIHDTLRQAGITAPVRSTRTMSATLDQQVIELILPEERRLVAKVTPRDASDRLHAETDALDALRRPGHLLVPRVHALCDTDRHTVLLMEKLTPAPTRIDEDAVWSRFGSDLAHHHLSTPPATYGWSRDNFLGPTPQPNTRCDDWIEFNAYRRLGYQLELAQLHAHLTGHQADTINRVIDRLPDFLPRHPAPALIHGDLWSGNAIPTLDPETDTPRIAVIDPAVSIGDAWADIAMMRLFGGFPQACFTAYYKANGDHEQLEYRLRVYQLYHTLNHLNIFGAGYKDSAMSIAHRLLTI